MHALEVKCVKDKGYLLNFNLKIWLSIFLILQLKGRLLLKLIIVLIIL